ncbi:YoaK family protein [Mycobacterium sp. Marseille-P9652]|uniref:YoaK family protein n=1 Tax=Mycobacterium sp. Marseille-P9652 TaxID=2654950 RepID=UPI0012E74E59|nr:YoaK family protein [Mycobacterium sp. Marseille-P9652]
MASETFNSEARLSWVLAVVAGVLGAISFTHSQGYFVVFMTGNAQRAVLSYFTHQPWLAASAALLMVSFVTGVVVASVCRRHFWVNHPHGPTVLTTISLLIATGLDVIDEGWEENFLDFAPILVLAFANGALNTSFVKNGEVSVPLSYVTGTIVKMGQGIERHIAGAGKVDDWLGYFLLLASFMLGAAVGGFISVVTNGTWMLVMATAVCALTTAYTYFHQDRRALLKERAEADRADAEK